MPDIWKQPVWHVKCVKVYLHQRYHAGHLRTTGVESNVCYEKKMKYNILFLKMLSGVYLTLALTNTCVKS